MSISIETLFTLITGIVMVAGGVGYYRAQVIATKNELSLHKELTEKFIEDTNINFKDVNDIITAAISEVKRLIQSEIKEASNTMQVNIDKLELRHEKDTKYIEQTRSQKLNEVLRTVEMLKDDIESKENQLHKRIANIGSENKQIKIDVIKLKMKHKMKKKI